MARMSTFERWLVRSPLRARLQRGEVRAFARWAALSPGASVLDMGCGTGVSTALILETLRPQRLAAFDFDPSMVELARRRLARHHQGHDLHLTAADATRMPYGDGLFDAVFESGVVHHIPDWRAALREVGRVLKPGGRFCFAEPSRGRLRRGLYRILPHSVESMFDLDEWRSALAEAGLQVEGSLRCLPLWDICGVATKGAQTREAPS
jgi:ubiquinone/menaquinone biosynthesis C-methylase UbiE